MSIHRTALLLLLTLGCTDKDSAEPDSQQPDEHSDAPDSAESDPPHGDSPPDSPFEDSQIEDTDDTGPVEVLTGCLGQPNPGDLGPETCVAAAPCRGRKLSVKSPNRGLPDDWDTGQAGTESASRASAR